MQLKEYVKLLELLAVPEIGLHQMAHNAFHVLLMKELRTMVKPVHLIIAGLISILQH